MSTASLLLLTYTQRLSIYSKEIPYNRSCESIHVSEHWCVCHISRRIHDLHSVRPMAEFVVTKLNDLLHDKYSN
ncbi:unnamed protein product, partial [Oppiella nova]